VPDHCCYRGVQNWSGSQEGYKVLSKIMHKSRINIKGKSRGQRANTMAANTNFVSLVQQSTQYVTYSQT